MKTILFAQHLDWWRPSQPACSLDGVRRPREWPAPSPCESELRSHQEGIALSALIREVLAEGQGGPEEGRLIPGLSAVRSRPAV
ncbi:MAG: hypothetical protein M5U22_21605 [Thermoleophilia bacterium]|nr:hypothetical protein [Thermoleophilia bacterium]